MSKELNDQNFESFLGSTDKYVLVDVWAEWCGPCSFFGPIIEEVANEHKEYIEVGKLDVDAFPQIAQKYSVMSIPTVIIFDNGRVVDRIVGAYPKDKFVEKIKKYLS